jgi:hypothetical protein
MPRRTRPAGEFALVAAGLLIAVFTVAAFVATSVDSNVATAVGRIGGPFVSVQLSR